MLFHFVLRLLVSAARDVHTKRSREFFEKLNKLLFLDFLALESDSLFDPDIVKFCEVLTKYFNWVVIVHIEHFELLDNNQNEQVEHDVTDDQNKQNVEYGSQRASTSFHGRTIWGRVDAVIHQSIPIFSCRNGE